ncbi:hypothetical protein I4U23_006174 [Adineta vaga]|nr:hypothetical protein I4U23_006174 [Adineta vaga]
MEESEEQQQQLKQNASHLLEQFQQQMKIEKNKEKELDAMYPEDAAKQWSRYDQQWNDDQQLRLKLLRPILNERQNQLIQQLHLFKQQQKDIYEKQRLLIDDMEQARKYDLIEKQKMLVIQKEPVQSIVYDEPNHPIEQIIPQEILIPPTDSKFYGRRRFNWN